MARLNEPNVSPESFESLKRKFIRQNREIARVNSTQSLRIRDLENDNSKLLSENLKLREQIIRLESEQENKQREGSRDKIAQLKAQLVSKLQEIGGLVSDLSQEVTEPKSSLNCARISGVSTSYNEVERWGNIFSGNEILASPNGRLPPIMEDLSCPRQISENQDVSNQLANTDLLLTESPEIESPPKSQFVDTDPVKIDLPTRIEEVQVEESVLPNPMLSATVEQRKRRKDSVESVNAKRSNYTVSMSERKELNGSLRKGAKRKMSTRIEEKKAVEEEIRKEESFVVKKSETRFPTVLKITQNVTESDLETDEELANMGNNHRDCPHNTQGSRDRQKYSTRKALAPKNVNTSPKKRSFKGETKKLLGKETQNTPILNERTRGKVIQIAPLKESTETVLETTEFPYQPVSQSRLHASSDVNQVSPSITEISSDTQIKKQDDNLAPLDLDLPQTDSSRPSRRLRGSVSYAEPNLRHKMRRPTNELTDAVSKDRTIHLDHHSTKLEEREHLNTSIYLTDSKESNCESTELGPSHEAQEPLCSTSEQKSYPAMEERNRSSSVQKIIGTDSVTPKNISNTKYRKKNDSGSQGYVGDVSQKAEIVVDNSKLTLKVSNEENDEGSDSLKSYPPHESNSNLEVTAMKSETTSRRRRRSTFSMQGATPTSNSKITPEGLRENESKTMKILSSGEIPDTRVSVSTR